MTPDKAKGRKDEPSIVFTRKSYNVLHNTTLKKVKACN